MQQPPLIARGIAFGSGVAVAEMHIRSANSTVGISSQLTASESLPRCSNNAYARKKENPRNWRKAGDLHYRALSWLALGVQKELGQ